MQGQFHPQSGYKTSHKIRRVKRQERKVRSWEASPMQEKQETKGLEKKEGKGSLRRGFGLSNFTESLIEI